LQTDVNVPKDSTVISKYEITYKETYFSVRILKPIEEKIGIGIRMSNPAVRIRGSESVSKSHGSKTLFTSCQNLSGNVENPVLSLENLFPRSLDLNT
jgi:hypothetical protein